MNRKATSKPMKAIMTKIVEYYKVCLSAVHDDPTIFPERGRDFLSDEQLACLSPSRGQDRQYPLFQEWLEYFVFPEQVIINDPVEDWPLCDCLISFHSTDFPLHKVRPVLLPETSPPFRPSSTSSSVGRM